jgi:hypothetical protein
VTTSVVLWRCGDGIALTPFFDVAKAMMGLQIGKNSATGHIGNWRLPGFLIKTIRKTLFVEGLPKAVDGSAF